MPTKTRKNSKPSMSTLQKFVKKYHVTRSGSKKTIATRLWKLERHVMTLKNLKYIENFLALPPSKRYKGPRFYLRNDGNRVVPV